MLFINTLLFLTSVENKHQFWPLICMQWNSPMLATISVARALQKRYKNPIFILTETLCVTSVKALHCNLHFQIIPESLYTIVCVTHVTHSLP